MPAVGISRDPATAVAEGPLVEPDRELAPVGSPVPREVVDLGSSEGSVNGLSRQEGSRASSFDLASACSSWCDTSSELDL